MKKKIGDSNSTSHIFLFYEIRVSYMEALKRKLIPSASVAAAAAAEDAIAHPNGSQGGTRKGRR